MRLIGLSHSNLTSRLRFLSIAIVAVLGAVLGTLSPEVPYDTSLILLPLLALIAGISSTWSG